MEKGNLLLKETPYSEITAILEMLGSCGVRRGHLAYMRANNGEFAAKVAEFIISQGSELEEPTRSTFKVIVDYAMTLEQMISAGKYDWVNSDITSDRFPVKGQGKQEVEVTLFYFGKNMTPDGVIAKMYKAGYRPARIEELLALGSTNQELQKQFPIVALGSVWQHLNGFRCVPCLGWRGRGRGLRLHWFGGDWSDCCRFLAVRK